MRRIDRERPSYAEDRALDCLVLGWHMSWPSTAWKTGRRWLPGLCSYSVMSMGRRASEFMGALSRPFWQERAASPPDLRHSRMAPATAGGLAPPDRRYGAYGTNRSNEMGAEMARGLGGNRPATNCRLQQEMSVS